MKIKLLHITALFMVFSFAACGQQIQTTAERFIYFLNNYEKDSLNNLLTDSFQVKRTFVNYSNNKFSFLNKYLSYCKAVNGKFIILKVIDENKPQQFLVQDESDYLKYLHIDFPTWKITVTTKNNKVEEMLIDSTDTFNKYMADIRPKDEDFQNWLSENYPKDSFDSLYTVPGLYIDRLKKYATAKK